MIILTIFCANAASARQVLPPALKNWQKLEEGRQSSMFDDHPASAERAQHIRDRMSADGIK